MKNYKLHKDDIKVRVEPKPTTSVIPFAKEAVVGRTIHMCFQEADSMHFYKGKISYYDESAGTFHIDFFDGDTADIDFVSGGDTILWETMDVTRDAQWPEESSDLDIVPEEEEEEEEARMQVLPRMVGEEGKVPEEAEAKGDDAKKEVAIQPEEEGRKEEKGDKKEVEVGMDGLEAKVDEKKDGMLLQPVEERQTEPKEEMVKEEETVKGKDEEISLTPAPSIMDGVVMGKKSPVKPMLSEKQAPVQEKPQKDGVDQGAAKTFVGVKRKEVVMMKEDGVAGLKHAKVEKEDGVAKVPISSVQEGLALRQEKDTPATGTVIFLFNSIFLCFFYSIHVYICTQS